MLLKLLLLLFLLRKRSSDRRVVREGEMSLLLHRGWHRPHRAELLLRVPLVLRLEEREELGLLGKNTRVASGREEIGEVGHVERGDGEGVGVSLGSRRDPVGVLADGEEIEGVHGSVEGVRRKRVVNWEEGGGEGARLERDQRSSRRVLVW